MSRQLYGLLYFYLTDLKRGFIIFWSILLITMCLTLIVGYLLVNVEDGAMYFSPSSALYVYCAILGFVIVKEGIPFSIKMGATRKNLYMAMGIFFLGLGIAESVLISIVHMVIERITSVFSIESYVLVHPSMLLSDTFMNRVIIDTAIMFFLLSVMFVIGLLFYKYGLLGGGSVVGILVIILLACIAKGWAADFFIDIYHSLDMTLFYQLLLIGIVLYGISWFLLRRITIVSTK
ncbi:hypothetical protein [Virgibacillus oceani]|uniref:Uncharacterized protein n=1 Tax=Virgibacillus oceani TaxID=1479511 RepID=A0A917HQU3_9BACI|nr:hypothetical protein [Virgibacillus oceani]GGG87465.1 hypothetical protein GCM10011398_36650 [Virgibacillus oceani]